MFCKIVTFTIKVYYQLIW